MNIFKKLRNKLIKEYAEVYSGLSVEFQNILVRLSQKRDKPLNHPTSIILVITSNCMLRCQQCDLWKTKPEKQIDFAHAKIVLDKLHSWLGDFYLHITGGEPFINQDLTRIIEYAEKIGITTHVSSNAFIINPDLAQRIIDSHLSSISISLDGANAKTHDQLRGMKGAYQKIFNSIKLLRKYDQDNRLKIYLNSVIMEPNVQQLSQIVNVATESQVNGLTFQNLLPNLGSNNPTKHHLWPKYTDLSQGINKILRNLSHTPILLNSQSDLKYTKKYYQNPGIVKKATCSAGINNFIVNQFGDVRLCFSFPTIGNIFQEDPKKIWYNDQAIKQRQTIRSCQRPCKMILCNRINTKRQQQVIIKSFDKYLAKSS